MLHGMSILPCFVLFWLRCVAYGILVPQPGIEPGAPAVRVLSPNHWTAREFPFCFFRLLVFLILLYL